MLGYCIRSWLWQYGGMGNKDSHRREKKKPKKQIPKTSMRRDEHPVPADTRINKPPAADRP
jgi:hypothetical protein